MDNENCTRVDDEDFTPPIWEWKELLGYLNRINSLAEILCYSAHHQEQLCGATVWEIADLIQNLSDDAIEISYVLQEEHGITTEETDPGESTASNPGPTGIQR